MDKITVSKEQLTKIIKSNLDEHIKEFNEAMSGYKAAYELYLKKLIVHVQKEVDRVRKSNYTTTTDLDFHFDDPEPVSHEDDYNSILSMLSLHCDDKIELSMSDHQKFVMDNWNWKRDFVRTSSYYK